MAETTEHRFSDPDATWRRPPDPDETERRPIPPEQQADPDATERRPEPTPDATKRTVPSEQTAAQNAALHQTFPVTLHGRRDQLQITGRLGRGGEGELFLCTLSGRPYVAKILQQDSDYEVLSAMVERQESLEGRHLVPCLYLGRMSDVEGSGLDARRYIVHPYYAKGDLAALENVRRINPSIVFDGDESEFRPQAESYRHVTCDYSKVDEDAFSDLVAQVAKALSALHAVSFASGTAGAVHRDIKPQNIFVDENGRYALGDFGLVSAMSTGSTMKFTQRIGLSHGYSPPEAYSDRAFKQTVTRKYDYFSLGMTLLHIAGGRPRYIIDNELAQTDPRVMTIGDFYETIMMSAVSVPSDLPRRIRNLIRGLLAADPDHRWGAREVSAWLDGENPLILSADAPGSEGIAIRSRSGTNLIRGAQETAGELLRGWDTYARMLEDEDGFPFAWDGADESYRQAVERAADAAQFEDPDIGLQRLILTVYPQMGHAFRGRRFESDDALGRAMYTAAKTENPREIAFFTEYLSKGALSSAWRVSGARRTEEALRAVMRLEAGAQKRPGAALRAAAAMLMGAGAPPARVRAGDNVLSFAGAGELSSWVRQELERSLDNYRRPILAGSAPRIPGIWNAGSCEVLRQTDGSILLRSSATTEPFPVSGALLSLASAVVSPRREDAKTGDALSAMLFSDGYIGTIECTGTGSTGDGFLPAVLLDFLALFPEARSGFDDIFTGMLDAFLERISYISAAKLPFASSSHVQRIDLAANRAKDAAATFSRTRSFADFVQAVGQANNTRAVLAGLRDMNYDAAKAVLALAPKVMSSSDEEVKERFSAIAEEYQKSAGDAQDIEQLLESVREFQEYFAHRKRSDLAPYLLSDTMLFIRNYNQTSAQPMVIILPNTMDAKEYYEKLTEQVSRQRRRLVDAGLGDENGNVRA